MQRYRGTLVARNIAKSYGDTVVLDRLSLTVTPSSRVGVVGPNGIGKSTLLRLLAGLEEPDSGTIKREPPDLSVAYLAQQLDVAVRGVKIRCAFPKNADLQVGPDFWHPALSRPSRLGGRPQGALDLQRVVRSTTRQGVPRGNLGSRDDALCSRSRGRSRTALPVATPQPCPRRSPDRRAGAAAHPRSAAACVRRQRRTARHTGRRSSERAPCGCQETLLRGAHRGA
jgi:energy-coupling factor transporter ATP-binding protein EcfA2